MSTVPRDASVADAKMNEINGGETSDQERLFEAVVDPTDQPADMEGVVEVREATSNSGNAAGEDELLSGTYTWTIENFSRIRDVADGREYSPRFEVGTYEWRVLVIPRGVNQNNKFVSVYLDCPDAAWTPAHLNPRAGFDLIVHNQLDRSKDVTKGEPSHTFQSQETDWGFNQFMPTEEMEEGHGFVVNDTLVVSARIKVLRDERYNTQIRAATGHVGLKNQGATCYMNSLLQYLYNIPYFRKAVYHMPTADVEDASKSLPLALQRLFFKLQYSRTAVSTKDLTKSFGWGTYDAFLQHDVQELNRVLCEKLEEKMKGTSVERIINELFEGHTYNFIECVNVDYRSTRRESYMDLQLDVKGCQDVYASFDKYTEVEMMTGDNQYKAEGHGLQDARKGVLFESFPPILQLQLKRFEYDFQRDSMVKINQRYEFPDELDLDVGDGKYLAPNADRKVRNLYKLHSVLVHSGGVHGGHYYAFIRPDGKQWLKFDDDTVTLQTPQQATEEQYGGEQETPAPPLLGAGPQFGGNDVLRPSGGGMKFMKHSNAYMLVYVRKEQWDHYMCAVTKEDMPRDLRAQLEAEQAAKEQRQRNKMEAHLYVNVKLCTDVQMAAAVGKGTWFDLCNFDQLPPSNDLRLRKHMNFKELKQLVAEQLGVPLDRQRYWVWQYRSNKTFRVHQQLGQQFQDMDLCELNELRERAPNPHRPSVFELRLYLETSWPDPEVPLPHIKAGAQVLLFLKFYDPKEQTLRYLGHIFAPTTVAVQDLFNTLRIKAGLAADTPLEAFEEVKFDPLMITPLQPEQGLVDGAKLGMGDIIIYQAAVPQDEGVREYRFPRACDFLEYISARRLVNFKPLPGSSSSMSSSSEQQQQQQQQQQHHQAAPGSGPPSSGGAQAAPEQGVFQLELLKDDSYDAVTEAVGRHLGVEDPRLIRLTQQHFNTHMPLRAPLRYRGLATLADIMSQQGHPVDTVYYEVVDLPLPELEVLKTLQVHVHNVRGEQVTNVQLRVPKDSSSVADVLTALRQRLGPEWQEQQLRLLEIFSHRIFKVFGLEEQLGDVKTDYWTLRAEPIPEDQVMLGAGDVLLPCYHTRISKPPKAEGEAAPPPPQVSGNFGDPLLLRVGEGEALSSVKQRLMEQLAVSGEEFGKWQWAAVSAKNAPEFLQEEDMVAVRCGRAGNGGGGGSGSGGSPTPAWGPTTLSTNYLAMVHEDKGPKRPSSTNKYGLERAIKINA